MLYPAELRARMTTAIVYHAQRKLAASFVVTVAVLPGCRKTGMAPRETETASVWASPDGKCFLNVPQHCPANATCNPPPPPEIDCPASMRDAAAPPAITRRPAGQEDWVRVKPAVYGYAGSCQYTTESFCAPPGKPHACTT